MHNAIQALSSEATLAAGKYVFDLQTLRDFIRLTFTTEGAGAVTKAACKALLEDG